MSYRVARTAAVAGITGPSFALSCSENNTIAAITLQGIHLFDMLANVNNREAFQFEYRFIATPTETNPAQDTDISRSVINRDIPFPDIHDVFLDRTISPSRQTDEAVSTAFRQVAWSPRLYIAEDNRCLLAAVTADHRVILYNNGRWTWEELEEPSLRLVEKLRSREWQDADQASPLEGLTQLFSKVKRRAYLLGTIAVVWSPLYSCNSLEWTWLFCLQRSGHLVVWKIDSPYTQMQFAFLHDLQLENPSVVKIFPISSEKLLIFVGTIHGIVKCYIFSWNGTEQVAILPVDPAICEADEMAVGSMEADGKTLIIAKSCAIIAVSFTYTSNGFQVIDEKATLLPSLRISGLQLVRRGEFVCSTDDYQIHSITVGNDTYGKLVFQLNSMPLPINAAMLCRGIATPWFHSDMALFVLESIKIPFDHLQCRQPTNIVVYVKSQTEQVLQRLKCENNMADALIPLETYKSCQGNNWESLFENELENYSEEPVYSLQLFRWFSLYKSFISNDKDVQEELKARSRLLELCLRLRYTENMFQQVLNRSDPVNEDQILAIRLACEFATVTVTMAAGDSGFPIMCNEILIQRIREKFHIGDELTEEPCIICGSSIAFEKIESGRCVNGHGAPRCWATLRLCFFKTRRCRWCGVHFRNEPVFQPITTCIACGGPTRLL